MDNAKVDKIFRTYTMPMIDDLGLESVNYDIPELKIFAHRNHNLANEVFPMMRLHRHNDIEIIYIRKGYCSYRVDDEVIRLNCGDAIIISSMKLHLLISEDVDYDLDCIIFDPELIETCDFIKNEYIDPLFGLGAPSYYLFHKDISADKPIIDKIGMLVDIYYPGNQGLELFSCLFKICQNVYDRNKNEPITHTLNVSERDIVSTMIFYIDKHYKEKIYIHDLCKVGGVSKNVCTELFKKYTDISPIEYLRQYRLLKSMEYLKNTQLSITEIAFSVGFNSSSYYCESFRQIYNMSPMEYRTS